MIEITLMSRQPSRVSWALDWLNHKCPILLGLLVDATTAITYSSATNSYLTFCKLHNLSIDLTPNTLSYYITFQFHFISPISVDSYSGHQNLYNVLHFCKDILRSQKIKLLKS